MDNNMIFTRKTLVDATHVDRWGRMRPASLLEVMQETAGDHAALLGVGREQLDPRGLFWAIVRQTIEIHRLPGTALLGKRSFYLFLHSLRRKLSQPAFGSF